MTDRRWWLLLGGILVLAAILRFDALPTRGTWDADQGHDMLTLMAFVHDGVFPLVGPPTSIGDFHHGAAYYYLLAPSAWLGGGDPAVVVGEIALLGVLAVGLVASLARAVGGVVAGATAGLLMAVSATAIDESTFIWNPNLVAFTSALAVTAAWRAWTTKRARWWLLAAAAQAATMQCHVLGFVLLPPLVVWLIADARRRPATERGAVVRVALGGIAVIALSYVPLLASELQTQFHESREALAFIAGGGQSVAPGPLLRMTFVTLRVLAWPVSGLLIDSLAVGVPAAVVVATFAVWRARVATGLERDLARWLAVTMAWSCVILGLAIAGLANVTALPVDHYHAFLDPFVFLVVGLGFAALARSGSASPLADRASKAPERRRRGGAAHVGAVAVVALMVGLIGWNVWRMPPFVAHDGGYPAAETAAAADRHRCRRAQGPHREPARLQERRGLPLPGRPAGRQPAPDRPRHGRPGGVRRRLRRPLRDRLRRPGRGSLGGRPGRTATPRRPLRRRSGPDHLGLHRIRTGGPDSRPLASPSARRPSPSARGRSRAPEGAAERSAAQPERPTAQPERPTAQPERPTPIGDAGGGPVKTRFRGVSHYATLELHIERHPELWLERVGRRPRARRAAVAAGTRRRGHGADTAAVAAGTRRRGHGADTAARGAAGARRRGGPRGRGGGNDERRPPRGRRSSSPRPGRGGDRASAL